MPHFWCPKPNIKVRLVFVIKLLSAIFLHKLVRLLSFFISTCQLTLFVRSKIQDIYGTAIRLWRPILPRNCSKRFSLSEAKENRVSNNRVLLFLTPVAITNPYRI